MGTQFQEKPYRTFDGKKYYLWDSSFRKSDVQKKAAKMRSRGLAARVLEEPNRFAPKGVSYRLYVRGSILDLASRGF